MIVPAWRKRLVCSQCGGPPGRHGGEWNRAVINTQQIDWEAPMPKAGEPKQHVPVFVGSTYEDLKDYRTAVREALHRLETIVRGMEYFGSKPGTPKDECLKSVQSCKAYIGVFAMRYGSIDEESGKSMTHVEYDEAQRLHLPTLIYIIDEERQPVLPIFVDTGEKAQLLRELKEELKKNYQVSFFTTPEDLAKRIAQDLPPVLEGIGVHFEPEPQQVIEEDAKELLKRFQARPRKYAGREVTVNIKVTGDVLPVDESECSALKLPIGDAIERQVKHADRQLSSIIATGEMADWFEELQKGTDVTVRVKLLSGMEYYTDWWESGPNQERRLARGYQITKIMESKENVSSVNRD
jgi:hypothetical protein